MRYLKEKYVGYLILMLFGAFGRLGIISRLYSGISEFFCLLIFLLGFGNLAHKLFMNDDWVEAAREQGFLNRFRLYYFIGFMISIYWLFPLPETVKLFKHLF